MKISFFHRHSCLRERPLSSLKAALLLLLGLMTCPTAWGADAARPWVFWYWMESAVTKAGIEADLRAMSEAGLGGAYLMPIKGAIDPPHIDPPVEQLSPLFWEMVSHAMAVAKEEGLQLAMHACDGFAVAGGPWVKPEQSMQQLVWSRLDVRGEAPQRITLPRPLVRENYYRDIAVYAFPSLPGAGRDSHSLEAEAWAGDGETRLTHLLDPSNETRYRADEPGWIDIRFSESITCRSVRIQPERNNFQALRLRLMASDDGEIFSEVCTFEPPRHGWQDSGPVTWAIPETSGRVFRLVYDPRGSEPGGEDLDFAKWRSVLKLLHIRLSEEPCISNYEGKSGVVWRIAPEMSPESLGENLLVPGEAVRLLQGALTDDGELEVEVPAGGWTLLRMGHTSTGKTNYIGGKGKGLEIDKFSAEAARLQFRKWFGEAIEQAGPSLAGQVLKVFHVDSWECGSQNWSSGFRDDFKRLRGYDPLPYLPVVAGIPVESVALAEQFLYDLRLTISELTNDRFFGTLHELAAAAGCEFSAESVAPTMTADSLRHFGTVDLPMGEFWLRSPTHDKPTDILDAISGGHIYGKRIIQAEAFTQLRIRWDEHPGLLKALGDRHLAAGINRFVFHVFAHNPWLDRVPGMTLSGVGLYFQRDQVWWPAVRAWMDYLKVCQKWLQKGYPVVDIAVFTGEDVPSRSHLPEDLIGSLPGLIGEERIEAERQRLKNEGQPLREMPMGVRAAANIRDPLDWIDPLNGYAYDSINRDALLRLAEPVGDRLVLPGGANYGLLVIPGSRRTAPNASRLSLQSIEKLIQIVESGVPVVFEELPQLRAGIGWSAKQLDAAEERLVHLHGLIEAGGGPGPWRESSLESLGLSPDVKVSGAEAPGLTWAHRREGNQHIYFFSNQSAEVSAFELEFRLTGAVPFEINPVHGEVSSAITYESGERTRLRMELEPHGSRIVYFVPESEAASVPVVVPFDVDKARTHTVTGEWQLSFDPDHGGPDDPMRVTRLFDWTESPDTRIRYYSGKAVYETSFEWKEPLPERAAISLGEVFNVAMVTLNGRAVGTVWTEAQLLEVSGLLRVGKNTLRIEVFNTWANRLIGDHVEGALARTWTAAPYRLEGTSLLQAGLIGPVALSVIHTP